MAKRKTRAAKASANTECKTLSQGIHDAQQAGETMTAALHREAKEGETLTQVAHRLACTSAPAQPTKPGKPTGLASANVTTDGFDVTWNTVASATKYETSVSPAVPGFPAEVTTGKVTLTGGVPATEYTVSVKACNAAGCSTAATLKITTAAQDEAADTDTPN